MAFEKTIKEIWEVPSEKHQPGLVMHSAGWPLDSKTYGGPYGVRCSRTWSDWFPYPVPD